MTDLKKKPTTYFCPTYFAAAEKLSTDWELHSGFITEFFGQ
jgi:hypothetical protein